MTLAAPEWLLALLAVPALGVAAWLAWRKRSRRWRRLVAPRLESRLTRARPGWIHFVTMGLALAGYCGLVIAMAQPEAGEEWVEVENEGRNLLFCIDISRSMLAEDVAPSRLQAARSAALTILEGFPNDRVGVLLFAGETLVQSPLTIDHSYVEEVLAQLNPEDIPYGGSNLTGAVEEGTDLLRATGQRNNLMVVLSDGEKSTDGLERAARQAAENGVFIYALGLGTPEGAFIPDPQENDGRFRDRRGNPVFSRLDQTALETLARETDGYYSQGMGTDFLPKLETALAEMDRFREEGKYQRVAKPAHQWFLGAGIFLLMSSLLIRGLPLRPLTLLLTFALAIPTTRAGLIEDGRAALKNGFPDQAHDAFKKAAQNADGERAARLYLGAGSAAARAENWQGAIDSFSEALASGDSGVQQKACYGIGTALFYLGVPLEREAKIKAWEAAVRHFEEALEIQPDDEAARDNLATVKEELRKLQQPSPPPPPDQNEQASPEENQEENEDPAEPSPDEPGEENEKPQPQDGEGGQEKEETRSGESESSEGEENEKATEGEQAEPPREGENQGDQKGDKPSDEQAPGENEPSESPRGEREPNSEAPADETAEERARRLIRQFSDLGGKAPRKVRRPFKRAAQDW